MEIFNRNIPNEELVRFFADESIYTYSSDAVEVYCKDMELRIKAELKKLNKLTVKGTNNE